MVLVILSFTGELACQTDLPFPIKRFEFGFNIGLNYANAFVSNHSTMNTNVHNGAGFRLGLLMNNQVTERVTFSTKSELSFYDCQIKYGDSYVLRTYSVFPVSMEFMTHVCYTLKRYGTEPYVLAGPNVKVPLAENKTNNLSYGNNTDIAIDLGFGFRKPFKYYTLCPELRYSIGLRDISKDPRLEKVYFHNLALVLNFSG